jgi:predicted HicB family RNase H-like nuclease
MEKRSPHARITLRLPPDMHRRLKAAAASDSPCQSLNDEIVERLELSLRYETELYRLHMEAKYPRKGSGESK